MDFSMDRSYEVKRIYSDLIESCRGFENESLNDDAEKILKENITTGDALFREMEMSLAESLDELDDSQSNVGATRQILGNSASELYLACQHTKVCSSILKNAVRNAGSVACAFKIDEFLEALKGASLDASGSYSYLVAVRKLAYTAETVSYCVPHFHTAVGLIEKDDLTKKEEPPTPKVKTRVIRKKDDIKEEDATQKEVLDKSTEDNDDSKTDTPEGLAKDVIKAIKRKYKEQDAPQNMLEIAHGKNLTEMLSRLFGVAFVVRDGHVGLSVPREDQAGLDPTTALMLKPEKAPEKKQPRTDDKHRQQYIASFSGGLLKKIMELD